MKEPYTAVIKHSGAWWIGWIEEVPGVNCQEGTREELLERYGQRSERRCPSSPGPIALRRG